MLHGKCENPKMINDEYMCEFFLQVFAGWFLFAAGRVVKNQHEKILLHGDKFVDLEIFSSFHWKIQWKYENMKWYQIPASSKGCCLNMFEHSGMSYRHPLSSIQHPLEDPGMKSLWHFVGICCAQGGKSEKFGVKLSHLQDPTKSRVCTQCHGRYISLPQHSDTSWAPRADRYKWSYVTQK